MAGSFSIVDSSWELIDPNPDIFQLFAQFSKDFFWGQLGSVYVQWSPRMTLCAGLCRFHGRNRECSIHLSKPLLSLRPRKDLVETLLHEMIHAYLFVVDNNRERESHGPKFHEHMHRINKLTGAKITVYHTFNDEVDFYKTHWWKCDGPCQHRPPFFGLVKRSMNRAPGPNDFWHKEHQSRCGGKFTKIKEPTPKKGTKRKKDAKTSPEPDENKNKNKITNYFTPPASTQPTPATSTSPPTASETATIDPFSGRGFVLGSIGNSSTSVPKPPVPSTSGSSGVALGGSRSLPPGRGEHPLLAKWKQNYKGLEDLPSSSSSLAKTSTPAATTTVPKPPPEKRFQSTTLTSSILSTNCKKMKQSQDSIEVIDLD